MIMNKSLIALNKMIEKYDWVGKEYCRLIGKNESLHKVNQEAFESLANIIKQDLELLEQLKQQRDSLAINNGELVVKVCELEKENQGLKEQLGIDEVLSDAFERQSFEAVKDLDTFKLAFYTLWKCCNSMHTHTDIPDTDIYMEFRLGHESVYVPVTKEEIQAVADACDLLDLEYMEGE